MDYDDVPRANAKLIKLENVSDVNQDNAHREHVKLQSDISTRETSNTPNIGPIFNKQRDENLDTEYVNSQDLNTHFEMQIGKIPDPWQGFAVANTPGSFSGYNLNTNHALAAPNDGKMGEYPFQPELDFYPGPWNVGQHDPNSTPPAT